jgi:Cys-rich protein (TIGR01571 family)
LTQLANRLKLSACGTRAAGDTKASTFAIVTVLVVILFVAEFAFLGLYKNGNRAAVLFFLVWLGLIIWFIVLMARVRVTFRRHYKIPGDCCEDCCCMFWCSWCNTIRMLRQTHDEDEYPYQCCTLDGLPSKAPELV